MKMKKLFFALLLIFFLAGCGASVEQSEFFKHRSHYKNWEHTFYSWSGYHKPTAETGKMSNEQDWWGLPVEGK